MVNNCLLGLLNLALGVSVHFTDWTILVSDHYL